MLTDEPSVDELGREIERLRARTALLERENATLSRERDEGRLDPVLRDALDSLREGVALFDAEDRLILFNQRYHELYALIADQIVAGVTFRSLGAASVERGLFRGDREAQRDWYGRRAANRDKSQGSGREFV